MTNSEYFEKNKISFAKAMEIFNKQKSKGTKSFDKFLAAEHVKYKFKAGDLIVLQLNKETRRLGWSHNVVFEVVNPDYEGYDLRFLTPHRIWEINSVRWVLADFINRNCVLY